jgi:Uma2 family endonuclease
MSVAAVAHYYYALPDTPYAMWVRGELADHLRLPDDGTRVEVVGGEIVVSPGPTLDHNLIVGDVQDRFAEARGDDSGFPWRCVQTTDLNLVPVGDGYVPDLLVIATSVAKEVRRTRARHLLPDQVSLVVEVTSRSNAANDREPNLLRPVFTKWRGYAVAGVDHYLLINRDPRSQQSTLYTDPDPEAGRYESLTTWKFGETIGLPAPFGVDIPTSDWEPWEL